MSDIQWAEESIEPAALVRGVVARSVGLGLLAGAGEFIAIGAQSKLDLGFDEVEELVALLVRDAILALRALTVLVAEEACAEAVAVQLEAA